MLSGLLGGIFWALETVAIGIAMGLSPFISTEWAIFLAPFVSTFLHDAASAVFAFIYNAVRGELPAMLGAVRTPYFKWVVIASVIGGPVGMTGYVLAVNNMGSAIGAVASAIYPAVGTLLAWLFLKERVQWYRWIFLLFALFGVFGLSYSSDGGGGSLALGILGAAMCAIGWGVEAVILARAFSGGGIKNEHALVFRQATSALVYGLIILPALGGWGFTVSLFSDGIFPHIPAIAVAALFATASYLFYYRAISKVGASRAMALNITYTAWAVFFTVIVTRDVGILNPVTVLCAAVVVVCGILSATDIKQLFSKNKP